MSGDRSRKRHVAVVNYWVTDTRSSPPGLGWVILGLIAFPILVATLGQVRGRDINLDDGPIFWVFIAWVVCLFALYPYAIIANFVLHRRARARLETTGVESSSATVTRVAYVKPSGGDSPGDYWDVRYDYDAGITTRSASREFKKRPQIEVGDPVFIVYDAEHPEVHGWVI